MENFLLFTYSAGTMSKIFASKINNVVGTFGKNQIGDIFHTNVIFCQIAVVPFFQEHAQRSHAHHTQGFYEAK